MIWAASAFPTYPLADSVCSSPRPTFTSKERPRPQTTNARIPNSLMANSARRASRSTGRYVGTRPNPLCWDDSFPFQQGIKAIGCEVLDRLDLPGRPADLQRLDLLCCPQAKVQTEITLRDVTTATANLVGLRHPSGYDLDARPDCHAIAFSTRQFQTHPVAAGNSVVLQDHRRAIEILDHDVHIAVVEQVPDRQAA